MDEGQFLQTIFPPAYVYGGQGRFGFHEDMHMTESHPAVSGDTATKLFHEWSAYWDLSLPLLVEKSPPNILRMRFLQALFPESLFLIILRHPIAVAEATAKTARVSLIQLIEHTLYCYELMKEDMNYIQSFYLLRYEDLCNNPQGILDEVFKWIGTEKYRYDRKIVTDINRAYFQRWEERIASRLFMLVRRRKEEKLERRMNVFGYSKNDLELLGRMELKTKKRSSV